MGDKRNYAALDWLIGEIGDTLKDARQSLEAFVEDPRDTARIRFCLTHIHQVHGSLQMVEFHGASLFAEEMESLAEAIMHGTVTNEKEAHEALMRSLLQLPMYLEQVKSQHDDHPGIVLPLLNDLRAVRKQSYLSETNLFNPDLSSIDRVRGERHTVLQDKAKLKQVVQKLREMYQYAAASVLRGVDIDKNLGYIEKVLVRLEGVSRGTLCHPMWQVAAALAEALVRDDVELSIAVRGLLRYIARELRIIEEHCPAAFDAPARESLLRNLLYYVARSEDGGPRVAQVKKMYSLDKALLGGASARKPAGKGLISPPEPDAIRSVVLALQDELNTCKHLLDSALSGQGSLSDVEQMKPYVKRIGDTLAVLGIGEMRKQMMTQYDALERISAAGTYDDIQLIDIAGALANIENRLEAIAKGAGKILDYANVDERAVEIDSAKEAVLAECRSGLDQVKEAIVESLSTQWDPSRLPTAVETLHHIQGGLNMIPLARSAKVMELCGHFIQAQLVNRTSKPGNELQTLAEAIASIDYYLERLAAGHGDDLDGYLDLAEDCLAQLGYDFARLEPSKAAEMEVALADSVESPADSPAEVDYDLADDPASDVDDDDLITEQANKIAAMVDAAAEAQVAEENEETVELPAEPETSSAPSEAPSPVVATPQSAAADDEEESDIDDEIIEIFVEEAAEVLETLGEYFPKWRSNMDDQEALTTIRRAFHTLKGSGRMVEALAVGELAWSIEAMLNRVIDGSITPAEPHTKLIQMVLDMVPSLVSAFEHKSPIPDPALHAKYIELAEQLSKGVTPSELDGSGNYLDFVPQDAADEAGEMVDDDDAEDNEDQDLWEIFASEANTHLAVVDDFLADMARAAPLYSPPTDNLQRALHTLKGSAHMAAVTPIASLITPLEGFVKELRGYQVKVDEDILQLIADAAAYTREGLEHIYRRETVEIPRLEQFVARVQELLDRHITPLIHLHEQGAAGSKVVDPRLLALMMAEEMGLLLDSDAIVAGWRDEPFNQTEQMAQMVAEVNALAEAARQANLLQMSDLAVRIADVYNAALADGQPLHSSVLAALGAAHENVLDMVDQVAAGQDVQSARQEVEEALQTALDHYGATEQATSSSAESAADPEDQAANEYADFPFEGSADGFSSEEFRFDSDAQAETTHSAESSDDSPGMGMDFSADDVISVEDGDASDSAAADDIMGFDSDFDAGQAVELLAGDDSITDDNEDRIAEADIIDAAMGSHPAEPERGSVAEESLSSIDPTEDEQAPLLQDVEEPFVAEGFDFAPMDLAAEDVPVNPEYTEEGSFDSSASVYMAEDSDELVFDAGIPQEDESPIEELTEPAVSTEPTEDFVEVATYDVEESEESEPLEPEFTEMANERTVEPVSVVESMPRSGAVNVVAMSEAEMAHIDEEDFDADILEIFLEEAGELSEELDEAIHKWESDWDDSEPLETMKRALHTFKGGARLSGLRNLGELSHEYESFLIQSSGPHQQENFFQVVLAYQDRVHAGVKGVRALLDGETLSDAPMASVPEDLLHEEPVADEIAKVELASSEPLDEPEDLHSVADDFDEEPQAPAPKERTGVAEELETAQIVPFVRKGALTPKVGEDGDFLAPQTKPAASAPASNKRQGPQEMIKVSADLLEELVNLAGETSISRGRLQQQISDLSSAVDEVDGTLGRLNEQLRRLDLETEAQVLFRQEQMAAHEQFDPLEMDRYSQLQQLTRSLIESASDLGDLKATLTDKIKDTETLLLQQSRINSALQEGLMRSRMVPFSRLVPRLRRIVRQVSGELGKHVNFELDNVEGEMDRSVLERMVAPLEHMLRNAVDHGIEMPADRVSGGKPETGRILLSLAREGGDILLRLADDGRGINLTRVREKAVERGLMAADAELSDHDVMQFILQAGFSTAESVTQISGRGVGMDVVAAEIKQLGGSIVIDSKAKVGSQFTVRLPFTVSVNRALMVQLGNETYAIPLNTIEGIVRVSPFELEHYYSHPDARFEYAGENYQVRHLGSVLNGTGQPKLDGQVLPLPVILVRSAQNTMALQVDGLMGSREIVVKSLGRQFATVQGLSGATVMGDGSVVVILDPHAIVRREIALVNAPASTRALPEKAVPVAEERVKTIMVVDDSVTVRKVTTRFLEREGFNVITAKDGVDALQVLQDETPDLMLLDIEMPRMDGFEVAKNIRSTSRLKHLPIIMITSRTGDKHRQHALSIGVNDYLGKPYQEEQLLKTMQSLLNKRKAKA